MNDEPQPHRSGPIPTTFRLFAPLRGMPKRFIRALNGDNDIRIHPTDSPRTADDTFKHKLPAKPVDRDIGKLAAGVRRSDGGALSIGVDSQNVDGDSLQTEGGAKLTQAAPFWAGRVPKRIGGGKKRIHGDLLIMAAVVQRVDRQIMNTWPGPTLSDGPSSAPVAPVGRTKGKCCRYMGDCRNPGTDESR